jgi:hypothetical protein
MASIPIHNETDYTLTEAMTQQIIRDAQEHFGEEVRAIRVQAGIARHAFNARTREVRYAFSPQDFGVGETMPTVEESRAHDVGHLAEMRSQRQRSSQLHSRTSMGRTLRTLRLRRRTESHSKRRWKASMKGEMTEEEDDDFFKLMTLLKMRTRTRRTISSIMRRTRRINAASVRSPCGDDFTTLRAMAGRTTQIPPPILGAAFCHRDIGNDYNTKRLFFTFVFIPMNEIVLG